MNPSDISVIHETQDYMIKIGAMPAGELKGEQGYLLINKRTGICEGGVNVESAAIMILQQEQASLDAALDSLEEDAIDDDGFDAAMAKLKDKLNS